jgi:hypothetical protein
MTQAGDSRSIRFRCLASLSPRPRRAKMARLGEAMDQWHDCYLNTPAHTLPATVPNRRPVPAAPEPPFGCDDRDS